MRLRSAGRFCAQTKGRGLSDPAPILARVKVLVLGDSDSSGRHTGGQSWPELLGESLSRQGDGPAEVLSTTFSVLPETAPEFARKKVEATAPDAVVIVLGSWPFTASFVWLRLQQLFGKRVGRWYRGIEERFDARTRDEAGAPGRLNAFSRRVLRRVVGTKAFSTPEEVAQGYGRVFRTLATFEDARVVVIAYPGLGRHAREGNGPALRKRFFTDMRRIAGEHHFSWVDGGEAFAGVSEADLKLDDLHYTPLAHARLAAAVEGALQAPL